MLEHSPRSLRFDYRPYQRPLRSPLRTAHGMWRQRPGILVRLEDEHQRVGYGEIAPLPWFGSESWAQAIALCQTLAESALGATLLDTDLLTLPATHPACQFGFASALAWLDQPPVEPLPPLPIDRTCQLLPGGSATVPMGLSAWAQGYRTFKLKIGVESLAIEQQRVADLQAQLPAIVRLRLDANGGLTRGQAAQWLAWCDRQNAQPDQPHIEFIEQPLPPEDELGLQQFAQQYRTPIALDESVAQLADLQTWMQRGWPGIIVVKAAILGAPDRLAQLVQATPAPLVFSTVFETPIGQWAVQQQAIALNDPNLAWGLDSAAWFADDWQQLTAAALWQRVSAAPATLEGTW